jgi:hypothetical protein
VGATHRIHIGAGTIVIGPPPVRISPPAAGIGAGVQGFWEVFKAAEKVQEALDANAIIADALAEVDALEAWAKNPSAPVAKREHERNPAAQEQVLDTVANARLKMKVAAFAHFTTIGADTASGLAVEPPPTRSRHDPLDSPHSRPLERLGVPSTSCMDGGCVRVPERSSRPRST